MLSTGGAKVAGTENHIIWDGTCATLLDESHCSADASHGKQLSAKIQQTPDFDVKVLILSLNNVDPIPDGPLYCCDFEAEADPGSCCTITVTGALASDPGGGSLPVIGSTAKLCTSGSANQPGNAIGSINSGQPLSASNAAPAEAGANGPAPGAGGAAAPGGRPASQVLQGGGGGVRVGDTTPGVGEPTPPVAAPTAAVPTAAVSTPGAPAPAAAPQQAGAAATAPATSAPTAAATAAPPADTPTAQATVAPTPVATKAAVPTAQGRPAAKAESGGGLFGCQVVAGASAGPVAGIGLIALIGSVVSRRRAARRQQGSSRTQLWRGRHDGDD